MRPILHHFCARAAVVLLFAGLNAALAHNLQICKDSDPAGPVTGTFTFSVTGVGSVQVAVGNCVTLSGVGTEPITITEQAVAGVSVAAINISGAATATSDIGTRTAIVTVPEGGLAVVRFSNVAVVQGRFTGGGSVFTSSGQRVTHGFELHCSVSDVPNNLEINFGGDRFHLDTLTSVSCTVNPSTGTATIVGTGTGSFNGTSGYTIQFTMTDAGEPGTNDFASFLITSPTGAVVLNVAGTLTFGNQQFHPQRP